MFKIIVGNCRKINVCSAIPMSKGTVGVAMDTIVVFIK